MLVDEYFEIASSDKKQKVTPGSFYSGNGKRKTAIPPKFWSGNLDRWIHTSPQDVWLKRNSKRLMMIVRVPKRQKPSRNGRNSPCTRLNLNATKDYIVIAYVHQNPNFPPRIRKKNQNFEGLLWGSKNLGP